TSFKLISSGTETTDKLSTNKVLNTIERMLSIFTPSPTLNQFIISTAMIITNNKTPVVISIPTKSLKTLDKSCAAPLNPLAYTFALMRKKFSDTANKKEPKITTAIRFASIRNMCDSPFLSCKYFDGSLKHILNEGRCL